MSQFIRSKSATLRVAVVAALAVSWSIGAAPASAANGKANDTKKLVFIHTGDFHGDIESSPNARADASGYLEGGIARVATQVKKIRQKNPSNSVHVHTGDTISGGPEVLFSIGEDMVQLMDQLGVDVSNPGNWEFSYGIYRYLQFFGTPSDISTYSGTPNQAIVIPADKQGIVQTYGKPFVDGRRWGSLAANVYFDGRAVDTGVVKRNAGDLLTQPYRVKTVHGVRIGFIGCTTNRGPQVVSSNITRGIAFSNCNGNINFPANQPVQWPVVGGKYSHPNVDPSDVIDGVPPQQDGDDGLRALPEIPKFVKVLRTPAGQDVVRDYDGEGNPIYYVDSRTGQPFKGEGVDLVVLISEAGIAENLWNAERIDGIDIIFSSDMHEETNYPIVVKTPNGGRTIITEQPEDGRQVGELEIKLKGGKIVEWQWQGHDIDTRIGEDPAMKALVTQIQGKYRGAQFQAGQYSNPYNGGKLVQKLDTVVGSTEITIERNRFSNEHDPDNLIMPAVIEGTGHDLITDAFRVMLNADVGGIRGFRYTDTILPGQNITLADLYHYLSIGAMVAVGEIPAAPENEAAIPAGSNPKDQTTNKRHYLAFPQNLVQEIELSGNSTMNTTVTSWSGGWVWNYSGIKLDFDPYQANFNKFGTLERARTANVMLNTASGYIPIQNAPGGKLKYASYYYDVDYNRINRNALVTQNACAPGFPTRQCVGDKVLILAKAADTADAQLVLVNPAEFAQYKGTKVFQLDAVELVARYIAGDQIPVKDLDTNGDPAAVLYTAQGLKGVVKAADFKPTFPRINLVNALPDQLTEFGSPIIEPLRGALPAGATPPNAPAGWQPAFPPTSEWED